MAVGPEWTMKYITDSNNIFQTLLMLLLGRPNTIVTIVQKRWYKRKKSNHC